jgi:cytochrome c-type biogenesis protein CcmH
MKNISHEFHELLRIFWGEKDLSRETILPTRNRELTRVFFGWFREIRVIRGKGLAVMVLFAVVLSARPAAAQVATPPGPVTDNDVNRVARQLYCPVCENIPLDVCPTQACAQWRETIRAKLAAGWTDQQILDYFVAQYGERVLARPSTHGLNILVWVIPPILLLGGAAVLWRFLRQMRPAPITPASTVAGDEYTDRLEQELRKRI